MNREFKNDVQPKKFNKLLDDTKKEKKKVDIKGEFNFDNNAFSSGTGANVFEDRKANLERVKSSKPVKRKKAGRPIEIEDPRYKVVRSKKVSPAVEDKLLILQEYITEFAGETKRISFNQVVNQLADSYIEARLGSSKQERIKQEIQEGLEKLQKKLK